MLKQLSSQSKCSPIPKKSVNIKERIFGVYQTKKTVAKDILKKYQKLAGISFTNAKLTFLKLIMEKDKHYGTAYFEVKERAPDGKKSTESTILGVNIDGVSRINATTKVIKKPPFYIYIYISFVAYRTCEPLTQAMPIS